LTQVAGPGPLALGIDAAGRHGWVGVVVGRSGIVAVERHLQLAALVASAEDRAGASLAAVGVDIPIGLVRSPRRAADVAARAFVGRRRASVFPAPHHDVRDATSQAEANEVLRARGLPLLSAQAAMLLPRIREAAMVAAGDARVVEVFPEASFVAMAGHDLAHAKRAAAGALERLRLLDAADPSMRVPVELGEAGQVPLDDLTDAVAAAWSAHRVALGEAFALGDPAERDAATGRRIAIWV
jgi:predicted RNase H-like nuclease